MEGRKIGYWAATGLLAFAFAAGGLMDIAHGPGVVATMEHLGYPLYFAGILGAWKVLGAVAIVAPRYPRLKEWAYAGIFFDLSGAALSHLSVGDSAGKIMTPLVLLGVAVVSWALRPKDRAFALPQADVTGARAAPARYT